MNSTGPSGSSSIGFSTGIGRGAGDRRDDGNLLARERVEQRRFADVAPSEKGDVQPQTFWGSRSYPGYIGPAGFSAVSAAPDMDERAPCRRSHLVTAASLRRRAPAYPSGKQLRG